MRIFFLGVVSLLLSLSTIAQNFNLELRSKLPFSRSLNDIWGMNHSNGKEYALVGRTNGISVIDVSNPDNIRPAYSVNGVNSQWRDIKSFGNYAYGVTEGREGLTIIDLTNVESTGARHKFFTDNDSWNTSHNLYLDQSNGQMYIFGANFAQGKIGVLVYDVNNDPWNPEFIGFVPSPYVHDGFAKGKHLYLANINDGFFSIYDIENLQEPQLLSTKGTPMFFTHNIWTNADETLAFTTDERSAAGISAYDISDKTNPKFLDNIESDPEAAPIVHNVHVLNNYVITSYYSNGVTIHDASVPGKLAEVGRFDTSPFRNSNFNGAWGAFPFLNSGNILVSDIEQGLFVFTPTYTRASDFSGQVVDKVTGQNLTNVDINIVKDNHNVTKWTVSGSFEDRLLASNYTFVASKEGYIAEIVEVSPENGVFPFYRIELQPTAVSVSELDNTELLVSASNGIVSVKANVALKDVLLYNSNGQLLQHHRANGAELNFSLASSGVYILHATDAAGKLHRSKFVLR